jgi:hypothetical protein
MDVGATIETSLRGLRRRMRPAFTQERATPSAGRQSGGLLGEEQRKNCWMRADAAAIQRLGKGYVLGVCPTSGSTPG